MKDYYSVLDIPATATQEQIRSQYRQLVRIYHPDRFRNSQDKAYAEEKLKEINEAYRALSEAMAQVYANDEAQFVDSPIVEPAIIDFGTLHWGDHATRSFQVGNPGGTAQSINFIYSEENAWFKVTNGRRVYLDKPVPMQFEVLADVRQLEPAQIYQGWIEINVDGATARVLLMAQVEQTRTLFGFSPRLALTLLMFVVIIAGLLAAPFLTAWPLGGRAIWSPSAAAPLFAPQPGQLLFSVAEDSRRLLYVAKADGEDQHSLGMPGWSPVFSPVGQQMAFLSDANDVTQLYLLSVAGSKPRQLTTGPEPKSAPAWSPDGQKLAFIAGAAQQGSLQVIDLVNDHLYALTTADMGAVDHFAWAPDGQQLLFDLRQGAAQRVYSVAVNGEHLEPFTDFDSWAPAWSLDGQRVAVASPHGIYTTDSHGSDVRQLNTAPADSPQWSHDGNYLAYITHPDTDQSANHAAAQLWIRAVDGGSPTRVTAAPGLDYAWSPTDDQLAFTTGNLQNHLPVLYLWVAGPNIEPRLIAEVNEPRVSWTQ